jgi:hypothetical protein
VECASCSVEQRLTELRSSASFLDASISRLTNKRRRQHKEATKDDNKVGGKSTNDKDKGEDGGCGDDEELNELQGELQDNLQERRLLERWAMQRTNDKGTKGNKGENNGKGSTLKEASSSPVASSALSLSLSSQAGAGAGGFLTSAAADAAVARLMSGDAAYAASVVRRRTGKRFVFSRLPPVLCFHVGRKVFSAVTGMPTKLTTRVRFPMKLDMTPFSAFGGDDWHAVSSAVSSSSSTGSGREDGSSGGSDDGGWSLEYDLCGVVQHHALGGGGGGGSDFGHYTAYRRLQTPQPRNHRHHRRHEGRKDSSGTEKSGGGGGGEQEDDHGGGSGRWVHISDASVVPASEEQVLAAEAYLLFYHRRASNTKGSYHGS